MILQKGGYYYSVYEGIRNAGLLLPLVFRQGYSLLSQKTRRKKKTKRRGQSLKAIKTPGYR
jgi:hypothetical protein